MSDPKSKLKTFIRNRFRILKNKDDGLGSSTSVGSGDTTIEEEEQPAQKHNQVHFYLLRHHIPSCLQPVKYTSSSTTSSPPQTIPDLIRITNKTLYHHLNQSGYASYEYYIQYTQTPSPPPPAFMAESTSTIDTTTTVTDISLSVSDDEAIEIDDLDSLFDDTDGDGEGHSDRDARMKKQKKVFHKHVTPRALLDELERLCAIQSGRSDSTSSIATSSSPDFALGFFGLGSWKVMAVPTPAAADANKRGQGIRNIDGVMAGGVSGLQAREFVHLMNRVYPSTPRRNATRRKQEVTSLVEHWKSGIMGRGAEAVAEGSRGTSGRRVLVKIGENVGSVREGGKDKDGEKGDESGSVDGEGVGEGEGGVKLMGEMDESDVSLASSYAGPCFI